MPKLENLPRELNKNNRQILLNTTAIPGITVSVHECDAFYHIYVWGGNATSVTFTDVIINVNLAEGYFPSGYYVGTLIETTPTATPGTKQAPFYVYPDKIALHGKGGTFTYPVGSSIIIPKTTV